MKNAPFGSAYYLGFIFGIVLFLGLNWYSLDVNYRGWDNFGEFGIPFSMKEEGGDLFARIIWFGLIADIAFWLILSFFIGWSFESLWKKVSANYPNQK